jgi:SAM-dependent methyltransferase
MIHRWIGTDAVNSVLKTDLFDEAVGEGLVPMLSENASEVIGIDISADVVEAAQKHHPSLISHCCDVRQIALADQSIDLVVSPSSLDHFENLNEFSIALRELWRVLRPGGRLIITMDNAANPAVALRNALPAHFLQKTGLVPYSIGATCGPRGLKQRLDATGFEVTDCQAFLHCPRVLAVAATRRVEARGCPQLEQRVLSNLMKLEKLSRSPLRFQTGYFVGCLAIRRPA